MEYRIIKMTILNFVIFIFCQKCYKVLLILSIQYVVDILYNIIIQGGFNHVKQSKIKRIDERKKYQEQETIV